MRPTVWATLLICVVLGLGVRAHSAAVRASSRAAAPAPNEQSPAWVVEGRWMKTQEEAIESALEKARDEISVHLKKKEPHLEWLPPPDYIRDHLLADLRPEDYPQGDVKNLRPINRSKHAMLEEERDFQGQLGPMRRIHLKVVLTPKQFDDIRRMDQQHRQQQRQVVSQQRQFFLARVLAGVVALLGTVVAYFKLEEATRGYYTTALRVGAIGVIAAVVAGLLLAA
jgi:hypothetical protein